jgi:hypothetical protein
VSAYGEDWEERGRSRLAAAALLLAALWPSGGALAVAGSAVEQVHLARPHPGQIRKPQSGDPRPWDRLGHVRHLVLDQYDDHLQRFRR